MRLHSLLLITFILSVGLPMMSNAQTTLVVTVRNIKVEQGSVRIAVFNNEADFLEKALTTKSIKATGDEVSIHFTDLPPGEYAVSVFHDENENGKLDKNFIGIPTEGFGFGNDAMGTFGPPSFEKAKILLSSSGSVNHGITLRFM